MKLGRAPTTHSMGADSDVIGYESSCLLADKTQEGKTKMKAGAGLLPDEATLRNIETPPGRFVG